VALENHPFVDYFSTLNILTSTYIGFSIYQGASLVNYKLRYWTYRLDARFVWGALLRREAATS
jgi:hypothetical protein